MSEKLSRNISTILVLDPEFYPDKKTNIETLNHWKICTPQTAVDDANADLANAIVQNKLDDCLLEITTFGPKLKFKSAAYISVAGGNCELLLNLMEIPLYQEIFVPENATLEIGELSTGRRVYVAIKGGINSPPDNNIIINTGDILHFDYKNNEHKQSQKDPFEIIPQMRPPIGHIVTDKNGRHAQWIISCVIGPFASAEYIAKSSVLTFFGKSHTVSSVSDLKGIQLIDACTLEIQDSGTDLREYAYQRGSLVVNNDGTTTIINNKHMKGNLVSLLTITLSDLWKISQLKPTDKIRFNPVHYNQACEMRTKQIFYVEQICNHFAYECSPEHKTETRCIKNKYGLLKMLDNSIIRVEYRCQGDQSILVRYSGHLDDYSSRIMSLSKYIKSDTHKSYNMNIKDIIPTICSLQVNYDSQELHMKDLLIFLEIFENKISL